MTIAAQAGEFGFAIQSAKIDTGGTFTVGSYTWRRHLAPTIDFGVFQEEPTFPLEVGGHTTPTGVYKQGYFVAGQIDLIPRLSDVYGWLLLATMGHASSVTGVNADGTTVAGVNTHIFNFDPSDENKQPWLATRKFVPGENGGASLGEVGYDCKIGGLQITIPGAGKIANRIQMIGRDFLHEDPASWTYGNNYEDSTLTPDAGNGQFKLAGVAYPLLGATVALDNGLTNPQQEHIIGQFTMDDIKSLTRRATIRIVYKYQNPGLYKAILAGSTVGTTFDPLPKIDSSAAGVYAFDARFKAPTNIGVTSTKYEMRIRANRVAWTQEGTITLAAGGFITQTFTGTILEPASGQDYLQLVLVNAVTSYPLP